MAEDARIAGNEGMARVCSRRAAGIIIKEYARRHTLPNPGFSALERLKYLQKLLDAPPQAREIARILLTRVNPEHELPYEVDPIQITRDLTDLLLGEYLD